MLTTSVSMAPDSPRIVVCSPHRAMSDWLAEACRHRGYQTLQWEPGAKGLAWGAAAAIVDVDPLSADPFGPLRTLAEALKPAPVIALLEFPRPDECEAARRQGATALLPSPVLLDDLYRELEAAMAGAMAAI